jgi:hypothetical protein
MNTNLPKQTIASAEVATTSFGIRAQPLVAVGIPRARVVEESIEMLLC